MFAVGRVAGAGEERSSVRPVTRRSPSSPAFASAAQVGAVSVDHVDLVVAAAERLPVALLGSSRFGEHELPVPSGDQTGTA